MVHGFERFLLIDCNSGRAGCGFALIVAYSDGGGKGKEGGSHGVFGFETVLRGAIR